MSLKYAVFLAFFAVAPRFAEDAAKKPDTARVVILRYDDKTGTKNFEYMPGSLQEAITKSMHTKFEFIEVDPGKIEPFIAQVRAQSKGVFGAKEAAEVCRLADIDILIYGNFTFSETEKEISINTEISLGSTDKFRTLSPTENRVDATIFQAADHVASDIVAEITKVALEQQQAKGKAELDAKKKTQLERTEKSKTWADQNWMISVGIGPSFFMLNRDNAHIDNAQPSASLQVYRRFVDNFHWGVLANFGSVKSNANNSPMQSNFDVGAVAAMAGYFFDLSPRWRWTNAAGLGYYVGKFSYYPQCSGNCMGYSSGSDIVKGPFITARTGMHFLIFSFLSLGLEGDWKMYYDSPKPVMAIGGTLSLSVVF
ncbi:MAG: hypothetical protein JSR44_08465 [Spirochaetes bacterium]|nr:hypothetical protein [Spirochaetota bacterium]